MFLISTNPLTPNYGCWAGDWGCLASEAMARTMASTIKNLGDFIADMITNSFNNRDCTVNGVTPIKEEHDEYAA